MPSDGPTIRLCEFPCARVLKACTTGAFAAAMMIPAACDLNSDLPAVDDEQAVAQISASPRSPRPLMGQEYRILSSPKVARLFSTLFPSKKAPAERTRIRSQIMRDGPVVCTVLHDAVHCKYKNCGILLRQVRAFTTDFSASVCEESAIWHRRCVI